MDDNKGYLISVNTSEFVYIEEISEQTPKDIVITDTSTNDFFTVVTHNGVIDVIPYVGSMDGTQILAMLTQLKDCLCPSTGINFTMTAVGE